MSDATAATAVREEEVPRGAVGFLGRVLAFVLVVIGLVSGMNYWRDDFGLWGHRQSVRLWGLEKTSKHLLAHRYIPDHFEHLLTGPSYAANLNPDDFEVPGLYNLAMDGANATEINYVVSKAIESGKIKTLILCLDPYIIKNSGFKGQQISPKEVLGSLYSTLPIKMIAWRLRGALAPKKDDAFHASERGWKDFSFEKHGMDIRKRVAKRPRPKRMVFDKAALRDLEALVNTARQHQIRILAWHFPMYRPWYEVHEETGDAERFREWMRPLFAKDERIDLNEWTDFTREHENYSDGHLSALGARRLSRLLGAKLQEEPNRRAAAPPQNRDARRR